MKFFFYKNVILWIRNILRFEGMMRELNSSFSVSIELVSHHGIISRKRGVFFKKLFTSRLFIAVKMLLKHNDKVLQIKFLLDKNNKRKCLLNNKRLF